MAKAIALYTGGIHNLREIAIREDGAIFSRTQSRGGYGYSWTSWSGGKRFMTATKVAATDTMECGFDTLRKASAGGACVNDACRFDKNGALRVRLPN